MELNMLVLFDGELGARETLRFIEEKIGFGLFAWDIAPHLVRWSIGMYALLDLPIGSVEPSLELLEEMTYPEDRWSLGDLKASTYEGLVMNREFRIIRRNGRLRTLSSKAEVLINPEGQPYRVIGTVIDTTAEHDFHARSEHIAQRWNLLLSLNKGQAWTALSDGKILTSPAVHKRLSSKDPPVVAPRQNWTELVHPEDRAATISAWTKAVGKNENYTFDFRCEDDDGNYRWTRSNATPLLSKDGLVIEWVGINYDIDRNPKATNGSQPFDALPGELIRGARGILNWSVSDLSEKANVSPSIVRRLEEFDGISTKLSGPLKAIRNTFELAGVEFSRFASGNIGITRK